MKIAIFYRSHNINYKFAIITQKQIKESGLEIDIDLVDLDKISHINYIVESKKTESIPDIIYVWETEYLEENPSCICSLSFIKPFLMNLYPEIHIETYSYKDREEVVIDNEINFTYNYKLFERIIKDVEIFNNTKNYLTINKETLRVESHVFKNDLWIEDYLYFHPYCEIVESKEKGNEILNIIIKERINTLQKEAEIIKREYKNRLHTLALEIDKLKNISEKL
jgi:hypothetical protein